MSVTVTLYTNSSDPKYLSKSLTTVVSSVTCQVKEPCDILSPQLILTYAAARKPVNYVYISDWGRYYFCRAEAEAGGRWILHCNVDTLTTYAAAIKNCSGVVIRSESIGKPTQIPDNKLPIHPGEVDVTAIRFDESPFLTGTAAAIPSVPTVVLSVLNAGGGTLGS